ncbi:MAG: HAMP domain-containing protein [Ignavibacteriae bacterium]|nr:HAMP domain-containing protein [Ignavibacteriota bacterium]
MKFFRVHNIRAHLTLWNILVFGGILVLYAVGTALFFLNTLNHQLDASLKEDLELVDQMALNTPGGEILIDTHEEEAGHLERFLEIWNADGEMIYRSKTLGDRVIGHVPDSTELAKGIHSVTLSDGTRLRVATTRHTSSHPHKIIRLSVDEEEYFSYIRDFLVVVLVGIPLGLVLVAVSAYVLVRRALTPVDLMVATARRISTKDLRERIPVKNPDDELGRLALALNDLLARVQGSFNQLKRFTADASHELRTPLTAMRSVGEVGLQRERSADEYREVIGSMLEETNRLTRLVDSLLVLSRADSGSRELHREQLDILDFALSIAALMDVLAEEKQQQLAVNGETGVIVSVDRTLLTQALLNLIDNAVKFSPPQSTIVIRVGEVDERHVFIDVSDSGPGIPKEEREKVFDRFYRVKNAAAGGAGLGLAIARWAVEANGGMIAMTDGEQSGATFHITLPKYDQP